MWERRTNKATKRHNKYIHLALYTESIEEEVKKKINFIHKCRRLENGIVHILHDIEPKNARFGMHTKHHFAIAATSIEKRYFNLYDEIMEFNETINNKVSYQNSNHDNWNWIRIDF